MGRGGGAILNGQIVLHDRVLGRGRFFLRLQNAFTSCVFEASKVTSTKTQESHIDCRPPDTSDKNRDAPPTSMAILL